MSPVGTSKRVTVLDYGMGNLFSVSRAFEVCGATVHLTNDPKEALDAERLVLPGVGAFEDGMKGLRQAGLTDSIREYVRKERPFLGICLGMQMMLEKSHEFGEHDGLGLVPGEVLRIPAISTDGVPLRVPHIGWNALVPAEDSPPWSGTPLKFTQPSTPVYFVHSFSVRPKVSAHRLAVTHYGGNEIVAAVASGLVFGCQYHPERSGPAGLKMIEGFLAL